MNIDISFTFPSVRVTREPREPSEQLSSGVRRNPKRRVMTAGGDNDTSVRSESERYLDSVTGKMAAPGDPRRGESPMRRKASPEDM